MMSFFKDTSIGRFFSNTLGINPKDFSADIFSMSSFGIGVAANSYYLGSVDFVLLQERNFILNNVISKISKKFSNANFTDEKDSELLKKINNPNSFQSKEEFLKEFVTAIEWDIIYCNCFG
jgi:hypothetical protein